MQTPWVVATRNHGKLVELVPMLAGRGIRAISLTEAGVAESAAEEALEVFETFEANARAKAAYYHQVTGLPCLADDSGLCVDVLQGRPGVRSRRLAAEMKRPAADSTTTEDEANNAALLQACWESRVPPPWIAHFECAAVIVAHQGAAAAEGRVDGVVIPEAHGTGGFGFDPYFLCAELGTTFAAATREQKARVSHRARAVHALLAALPADFLPART